MAKVTLYNLDKKSVGQIELADAVFAAEVNKGLLYEVVKAQLASRRSGSANTKTRSEIAGSTKKIRKQKGSGQSRKGASRATGLVGGATTHGPKPRSYAYRPTRQQRKGALCGALSMKLKEGRLLVLEGFDLPEIKTKGLAAVLDRLEVSRGSLIVDSVENTKLKMSARNLEEHQYLPPEGVNVYDVLRYENLVVTKNAVAALEARFKG